MSDTETDTETAEAEEHVYHPSANDYVMIAIILAVLTALEVGLYFAGRGGAPAFATVPALIGLTILKFALVVLWFMHLRFDKPLLRRLFLGGLVLAVVLYLIVAALSLL